MWRICSGVLVALALVLEAGATGFKRDGVTLELRLADPAALARIDAATDAQRDPRGRPPAGLTDLLVLMRPVEGQSQSQPPPPAETFRGDGWRPPEGRGTGGNYIEVQVLAVTGGRLNADSRAVCDRFEWDMLICRLPCEGGSFGMRRGNRPAEHFLVLGVAPQGGQQSASSRLGLRLGACRSRDAPVTTLRPGDGRLSVEIPLVEVRAPH